MSSSYSVFLSKKKDVLESILKNTINQAHALDREDDLLLGKLLKEREEYIKAYNKLMRSYKFADGSNINNETAEKEHAVDNLLQRISSLNNGNRKKAENRKKDLFDIVKQIRRDKYLLKNSYLKKIPQRVSYYFDKKI
jgi:hypothetical protein